MIQDDYLLKMIERVAVAVSQLLAGSHGRDEVDRAAEAALGLNTKTLAVLPAQVLIGMLSAAPDWRKQRTLAAASILEALAETEGDPMLLVKAKTLRESL